MISLKQAKLLTMLTLLTGLLGSTGYMVAMEEECVPKYKKHHKEYVETEFPTTKEHLLRYAIVQDDIVGVQNLIHLGADVNENNWVWGTPLNLAITVSNNENIVDLILQAGANANTKDRIQNTPLMNAIQKENVKAVELLLKYGANPNIASEIWGVPLITVVSNKNQDLTELLLSHEEIDPNIQNEKNGDTPLLSAIENHDKDMVKLLLKKGANPNLKTSKNSPLIAAVFTGDKKIVKLLLKEQADPRAKDKKGKSAIFWAQYSGNPDIIKLFRKYIEKKRETQFEFFGE